MQMPKPDTVDAGVRRLPRLDRMHSIGIAVLAVLVLTSQVLLQAGLSREVDDGPIINLAGRQRMLSQRIAKIAVLARQSTDAYTRSRLRGELAVALTDWSRAAQTLAASAAPLTRNTSVARTLAADLKSIEFAQSAMADGAEKLVKLLSDPDAGADVLEGPVQQILINEPTFLASMEVVVHDFERAAGEHVHGVRTLSVVLCIAILLMLIYQGTLVFKPAFRVIRDQFTALKSELAHRVEMEAALRTSEEWSTSLIGQLQSGIAVFDKDGYITAANAACERMFGLENGAILGKTPADLFADARSQGDPRTFKDVVQTMLSRVSERTGRRLDGSVFPCDVWIYEAQLPGGTSYVADMRDSTERREVERLKKEFVSTVSHELRTPLTSIRGSLSLLSAGVLGDLPGDAKEVVEIAERNVVRLITLINDILDLEKLDSGKLDMQFAPVSVQALMDRASEAVRGFAHQEGLSIAVTSTDAVANADDDRIVQVLVNLLSNAIKFSPGGSTISIEASIVGDEVEIRVIDRGRGIPKESLELIFERFRQVDSSDARRKGGTGLGLAICKAIMTQHGGSIRVMSEVGRGSTFAIRMPRAVRPLGLLFEGNETLRKRFATSLEEKGFDIAVAAKPEEAVHHLRNTPPDVAVLDLTADPAAAASLLEAAHFVQSLHGTPLFFVGEHILLAPDPSSRDLAAIIGGPGAGQRIVTAVRDNGLADVLLVEDDDAFAQVTALRLAQQGIFTRVATSARHAAAMMRERMPALLVLDIGLPDSDGFDLVSQLRRDDRAKRLPLIVYSGRDFDSGDRDRLTLGPTRFLTKSRVSEDEFTETVEELLGMPTAKKPANGSSQNIFKA